MSITDELQAASDNTPVKSYWKTMAIRVEHHNQIKDMADYYKISMSQVLNIILKKSYTEFLMEESQKIKERKENDK